MQISVPTGQSDRRPSPRLRLYGRAALFAVMAGFIVTVVGGSGADGAAGRLGGDFPAFYAAGSIVADGDWDELYSPDRQLAAQIDLFQAEPDSFLYFAYPPYVAAAYRPFAALDYRLAYTVHTLLMAGALAAALALVRPMVKLVAQRWELCLTAAVLFYPMLRGVTGGQNTAVTLLLLAGAWRALHEEREIAAGIAVAVLLYKPQFALPLMGLLLLTRHWRAVGGAAVGGAALWGLGALAMGSGWLATWWAEVADFAALDADINGHNAISWLGFAEGLFGAESTTALAVGVPLMGATAIGLSLLWRSALDPQATMAMTVLGLVLMSPHAMFYDAGLLVLPGVVAVDRLGPRAHVPVALIWVLAWSQFLAKPVGFAPLFVLVVVATAWLARSLKVAPALEIRRRPAVHAA